ncbi:hypothetical protein [Mesorhizobium escarrei]|uniref:hypothetical protein n=1 Tax=Mesorhizobium escarrei TaxID=666018 RepID=UPI0020A7C367|nr:hypothetical protein [Mesorhizobium escarrei]
MLVIELSSQLADNPANLCIAGNRSSAVVPDPRVLSISTLPPVSSAKRFTIGKPMPPRPLSFVVKRDRKREARSPASFQYRYR